MIFAQRIFNGLVRNMQLEKTSNKENNPDLHQTISEHEVINDADDAGINLIHFSYQLYCIIVFIHNEYIEIKIYKSMHRLMFSKYYLMNV